jgi:hypothetical protein
MTSPKATMIILKLLSTILSANQYVTLFGDTFFINKVPFFATISDHIKFTTTEHIANRKLKQLVLASLHVQAIYAARDFKIKVMIMDGEFVPLKHNLATAGIVLNTTAANEHAPKIERQIHVIKERVRATRHTLPGPIQGNPTHHARPSRLFHNHLVKRLSSQRRRLIPSKPSQYHYRYLIRLQQALSSPIRKLRPNSRRACNYINNASSHSWCHLAWSNWQLPRFLQVPQSTYRTTHYTPKVNRLPMPQEVIDRVNELGKANEQPELLTFYDRKGRLIGETENPGVSESIDTMITPDDGLGDLNNPTMNQDY